jgi:hypothetical protein
MNETAHKAERIRDVPASCTCTWTWQPRDTRWVRRMINHACRWHNSEVKP